MKYQSRTLPSRANLEVSTWYVSSMPLFWWFFLWSFSSLILSSCFLIWGFTRIFHSANVRALARIFIDIRAWFYHACLKTTCYLYRWLHFPAYMYESHLTIFFLWIYFHDCCLSQISHMVNVLLTEQCRTHSQPLVLGWKGCLGW